MTKPIIVVKIPGYKLLYIIQVKGFSWPYLRFWLLIIIATYNAASDWPRTFFTAELFLFSKLLLFVSTHREMLVISKP